MAKAHATEAFLEVAGKEGIGAGVPGAAAGGGAGAAGGGDGAGRGVAYYMAPRFREMTARSWLDGFEQIVYSLGLGIGSNIAAEPRGVSDPRASHLCGGDLTSPIVFKRRSFGR